MRLKNRLYIDVIYHMNSCNMCLNCKGSNKGRYYRMEC